MYEFTFKIIHEEDPPELDCPQSETFYALIMGGIESALKVSRLIIKEKTGDGAAPFDFELINLSKVENVPLFGNNSIKHFQENTVEKVAASLSREFNNSKDLDLVTVTRRVLATQNRI